MKERIAQCGAAGSSILASICCIGPALAASLGVAGLGALASLAVYRNYLMTLALLALGYSFFSHFRNKHRAGRLSLRKYQFGRDDLLLFLTTLLVVFALYFPQIQALTAAQSGTYYEGRGEVVDVNAKGEKVTLKHEEIKGLMPAMIMEFPVRPPELLDGMRQGDKVRFTLRPQGTDFVVEKIAKEEE